jgi:alkylhydroperoxidase family enzyme
MASIERPHSPRIAPVTDPGPAVAETLARTLLTGSGQPLNIFGTLARHPALLDRFNRFGGFLLNKGLLDPRERELVILRVGWNCRSVYEFGQHTVIGRREGLTDGEISALTGPARGHPWSASDRALIDMCDELCADDCVSGETYARVAGTHGDAEMLELLVVAGFYRLVSGFLNTFGVQLDPGVPGWPES